MPERGGGAAEMNELRILHAADLHLDSPFEALGGALAAQRRREQRALLQMLPALAEQRGARLILLPGDLLDSDSAYPETARLLAETFAGSEAHVCIAPGNHDFYSAHAPYARIDFPENVHIFRTPRLEPVELPELGVRVWGAAFPDSRCPGLLHGFSLEKREDMLDVLCVHGEVGVPGSAYNPVTEEELAASGFDYAAFGHVHRFSGTRRAGRTTYAWPGCIEGRGFDETGEKGVILATVRAGAAEVEFLPAGGRRYEILRVDVSGADAAQAVLDALPQGAQRHIFRVMLTGECDRAPDVPAVQRALEGRVFSVQVRDGTRLRQELWARAGEGTLRGLFLSELKTQYDAAQTQEERDLATMAARWGLAALDHDEEVFAL